MSYTDEEFLKLKEQYEQMRKLKDQLKNSDTMQCKGCHEIKPNDAFSFHNKTKGTRRAKCKVCIKKYNDERYAKNKEEIKLKEYIKYHKKKALTNTDASPAIITN